MSTGAAAASRSVPAAPLQHGAEDPYDRRLLLVLAAVGAGLGVFLCGILCVALALDRAAFSKIVAVLAATFVGGRLPGILAALELGFDGTTTTLLLVLLNTAWLLMAVPAMIGTWRGVARWRWLSNLRRATGQRASQQASVISNVGTWALPLFVWLPFPLTGAVVGAGIGLVLGIPLRRLMVVVLLSMWTGVVTWTLGMEYLYLFGGATGRIVCYALTAAALLYAIVLRFRGMVS